ncbi:MAG: hypothetical protein AB7J28_08855 [Hyphomonadaceae bacterium]
MIEADLQAVLNSAHTSMRRAMEEAPPGVSGVDAMAHHHAQAQVTLLGALLVELSHLRELLRAREESDA